MRADFDDVCLWTYVVIDELLVRLAPWLHRPGPAPDCSDSELLTLAIVGECRGWDVETELLSHWQAHRDLFPHLSSQSRFNRRRRQLADLVNRVRRALLELLDVAADRQCVIDSLPVPVMAFHLVPGSAMSVWSRRGSTSASPTPANSASVTRRATEQWRVHEVRTQPADTASHHGHGMPNTAPTSLLCACPIAIGKVYPFGAVFARIRAVDGVFMHNSLDMSQFFEQLIVNLCVVMREWALPPPLLPGSSDGC